MVNQRVTGFRIQFPSDRSQFHVQVEVFDPKYINRVGWLDIVVSRTVVPVEISAFTCAQKEKSVILKWETESEQANLGFNIYRRKQDESESVRINDYMITGSGTSAFAHSYEFIDESVEMNTTYLYKLEDVSLNGEHHFYTIESEINIASTIKDFSLDANYPNPFNAGITIEYQLPSPAKVTLTIFDLLGQQIITLVKSTQLEGVHQIHWDGRDFRNQPVATGLYLYRMQANDIVITKRMLYLK